MAHVWSLSTIVSAIVLGVWQRVLEWLHSLWFIGNYVAPMQQPGGPPTWWWNGSNWFDWYMHRDSHNVPDRQFIESWLRSAWNTLGYWVEEVGKWAKGEAQNWARSVTGYALYGWTTFSSWINNVWVRLGDGMVWWGQNVRDALDKLWNWLPPEIRTYVQTWAAIWDWIVQRARDWVFNTYHTYITWGTNAWAWVIATGGKLNDWWLGARGLLDEFRANPTGFIIARLGSTWTLLYHFAYNGLVYYVKLWGLHAQDLADFLADPAGWIYSRLEAYVERIW